MLLSDDDRAPLASYNSSSWRRFLFCIWTWLPAFYFVSFMRLANAKKRKTRLTHTQRQLGGKPAAAAAAAYTYREARQNIKGFYFSLYTVCVCVCLCWFVSVPRWTNDGGHSSSSRRRRQLMRSFSFVFVHPFRLPIHPLARPIDCHDPSTFFSSPAAAGCHFHLMTACLLIYSSNPEILFPPFWKRKDKKTKQNVSFFFLSICS